MRSQVLRVPRIMEKLNNHSTMTTNETYFISCEIVWYLKKLIIKRVSVALSKIVVFLRLHVNC